MLLDENLRQQTINWVVCDSLIQKQSVLATQIKLGWVGIKLSTGSIYQIRQKIATQKRIPVFPTQFSLGPRSRYHKDMMYSAFFRLADTAIKPDERIYWGLPAYHVESIRRWVGDTSRTTMCETDPEVIRWVTQLYQQVLHTTPPEIIQDDIFSALSKRSIQKKPANINIFDLDLMFCIRSTASFPIISKILYWNSAPVAVINLTTIIGRATSYVTYHKLMPHCIREAFLEAGFNQVDVYSGTYKDNKHPVMYEHLLVRK